MERFSKQVAVWAQTSLVVRFLHEQAFLLEFSHSDTEVFQVFLDEANEDLALARTRPPYSIFVSCSREAATHGSVHGNPGGPP